MDALDAFLSGPRARGAFLLRSIMSPPWSIRIEDRAPLTVVVMARGESWIVPDKGEPHELGAGDIALVRGADPYLVADRPGTPPQIVIHPGQRCTTVAGHSVSESMDLGVRTWGNDADGASVMFTGTYQADGEVSRRLLTVLPTLIILRRAEWDCPLIPVLSTEIVRNEPGQESVLDRLLDLLVIAALRTWFSRAGAPGWYHAHADPVVGPALRLLHNDPARPWTIAELAGEVGISRAALARRFHDLVGEPPIAYLSGWRMTLAADLLREPDATVGSVARKIGFASPFTFSTAFKRHYGMSPQRYRSDPTDTPAA